jgi:hypothetical protein
MIIETGIQLTTESDLTPYLDSTVRYFSDVEAASEYRVYLEQKASAIQGATVYWYELEIDNAFDQTEQVKQEALKKLTEEEKQALGLI